MRRLVALVALFASVALAQNNGNSGDKVFNSTTYPVFTLNAAPVPSASLQVIGNPGPATWYYWAVANYPVGSVISSLGSVSNAPNVLTSGNYVLITPTSYPSQVSSVDILATSTPLQPSGACACAVVTGLTAGSASQTSNSTSAYTVTLIDPRTYSLVIRNEVISSGVTHLLLRNAYTGTLVCDLSLGCGSGLGTVTSVTCGTGLSGGTFTTSGTCAVLTLANPIEIGGVSLSAGDTINFNASTPAAPTNGFNVTFATSKSGSTDSVSAAVVGDGNSAHCLLGTGVFGTCGTASGVTGSGTGQIIPVWTGTGASTALGNTNLVWTAAELNIGTSSPFTGANGMHEFTQPTVICAGTVVFPQPTFGCYGYFDQFESSSGTANGVTAGAVVGDYSNNLAESLGVGAYIFAEASANRTQEIGVYAEAYENVSAVVGTRRGLFAYAGNNTANTTATNQAIYAQTAVGSGATNTVDNTIEIAAPAVNGTMGTHAGLKVDAQGTGVGIQLGTQVFSALPACSSTYEGSLMPVTDSTVTSFGATITGSGSNHVFAYCNGTNWVVSASGVSQGVTHGGSASGCVSSGSACNVTITWNGGGFPSSTYTAVCTGLGPVTGQPQAAFVYTGTQTSTQIIATTDNRGTANPGGFTTINCIGTTN